MELIIQILMLFIVLNSVLKLSFHRSWQVIVFSLLCGLFVIAVYPYAIEQSKTQLADYLSNAKIMQDSAVLVTLEASVCFAFCFLYSKKLFGGKLSRWGRILQWYISLLIFPVLFYLLTQTIFTLSGTDFKTIAYLIAVAVTVGIPLLAWLVRYLFPESDFRLEVHFIASLFVCILGLVTTVNGNVTYAAVDEPVNWHALALAFGFFAVAFAAGYGWNRLKWIVRQRRELKNKTYDNQLKSM